MKNLDVMGWRRVITQMECTPARPAIIVCFRRKLRAQHLDGRTKAKHGWLGISDGASFATEWNLHIGSVLYLHVRRLRSDLIHLRSKVQEYV